jgi:tetratricopeptide (TPR) repeat protein
MRGDLEEHRTWAIRAVREGLAAGRPREAAQGVADAILATALGRTPFDAFVGIADELDAIGPHPLTASASAVVCAMAALGAGDDDLFAVHERARVEVLERHGLSWFAGVQGLVLAALESWTGRDVVAERRLLEAREVVAVTGDIWWLGMIDAIRCRVLANLGRRGEFLREVDAFEAADLVPDRDTLARRPLLRARALLARGSLAEAEDAIRMALVAVDGSDLLLTAAEANLALQEILEARGQAEGAAAADARARRLLEEKRFHAALVHLDADRPR